MMGTGSFAEPTFKAILGGPHSVAGLVTQPDRPAGHERGSTRQAERGMIDIARAHGVPIQQPASINTPEGVAGLRELQPDLVVVAAYGQILSKDVLAVPPLGGINVHASLLPKYRGAAPVAWAIYHGEERTGVTVIKMSVRLDAGDILAQEAIDIAPDETAGELEARLATLRARLAVQVIEQIAAGTDRGTKQDPGLVTKAPSWPRSTAPSTGRGTPVTLSTTSARCSRGPRLTPSFAALGRRRCGSFFTRRRYTRVSKAVQRRAR